ncbi:glycosyltransferase family A protein [uncultured Paenibacillus sp.]|uniref:glycosyltransferase family 2 protein n=1 Tax=uncultured Paenibacillus sp. TaxID=227322 RepID=UPI0028D6014E|nr:glycosyltransferase family A protein [uncultured Paenibacillus sp.]
MDVSVIVPTHNRTDMLLQAVESVCRQTVKPLEIIVVDDASERPPEQALEPLKRYGAAIRCIRFDSPRGACAARNEGAEQAKGGILMFLDDDDTWEPEKIERQLAVFRAKPEVGLVYGGRLVVGDADRDRVIGRIMPKARGRLFPAILYENHIGMTSSVALKRELFIEAGGFDPRFPALQDYDLWIRCSRLTVVDYDGRCNVRYTVASDPDRQISGRKDLHAGAVALLQDKYRREIEAQGALGKRKIYAGNYFYVAKAKRRHGLLAALPWCVRSVASYPSLKALLLLSPPGFVRWMKSLPFRFKRTPAPALGTRKEGNA